MRFVLHFVIPLPWLHLEFVAPRLDNIPARSYGGGHFATRASRIPLSHFRSGNLPAYGLCVGFVAPRLAYLFNDSYLLHHFVEQIVPRVFARVISAFMRSGVSGFRVRLEFMAPRLARIFNHSRVQRLCRNGSPRQKEIILGAYN